MCLAMGVSRLGVPQAVGFAAGSEGERDFFFFLPSRASTDKLSARPLPGCQRGSLLDRTFIGFIEPEASEFPLGFALRREKQIKWHFLLVWWDCGRIVQVSELLRPNPGHWSKALRFMTNMQELAGRGNVPGILKIEWQVTALSFTPFTPAMFERPAEKHEEHNRRRRDMPLKNQVRGLHGVRDMGIVSVSHGIFPRWTPRITAKGSPQSAALQAPSSVPGHHAHASAAARLPRGRGELGEHVVRGEEAWSGRDPAGSWKEKTHSLNMGTDKIRFLSFFFWGGEVASFLSSTLIWQGRFLGMCQTRFWGKGTGLQYLILRSDRSMVSHA